MLQCRVARVLLLLLMGACVDFDRDGWSVPADCDDANPGVHPGADEVCDAAQVDEDCDGRVNDADDVALAVFFVDQDGDGDGATNTAHLAESCAAAVGMVANGADCDDEDSLVHVGAAEVCDGRDNDCDGRVDDADDVVDPDSVTAWYGDADGDGYGGAQTVLTRCVPPPGYVATSDDCEDRDAAVSPGAAEICDNGVDDNCDGASDPCGLSGDLGAASVHLDLADSLGFDRVASAGDLDGDAWPDLVVGGESTATATVYYGPVPASVTSSRVEQRSFVGGAASRFGSSVLGARDFTGDGLPDLLVGAPGEAAAGADAGGVWILPGPIGWGAEVGVDDAPFLVGPGPGAEAGVTLAWAGDADGDGAEDLLVGAAESPLILDGRGSAYLVRGPVVADVDLAWADGIYLGGGPWDRLGSALAGAGDVDGDGLSDVLLGAPGQPSANARGTAYLLLGPATQGIEDADLRLVAATAGTFFGRGVAGADLDGDGHSDLVVSEPVDGRAGAVYVYDGADWPEATDDTTAVIAATDASQRTGRSLAILGDCNGDGLPDLAVGTPTLALEGTVSVFYGPVSGRRTPREADGVFSPGGVTVGTEVRAAGDLDVNGLVDVLSFEPTLQRSAGIDRVWITYAAGP